jgi:hypothetical protein
MTRRYIWLPLLWLAACRYPPDEPRLPQQQPLVYTADGDVLGVERASPEDAATYVQLVVRPGVEAPVRVELGPGWYLEQGGLRFTQGDKVHVEGWRSAHDGGKTIVAKRVRSSTGTLELRDSPSHPLWQ